MVVSRFLLRQNKEFIVHCLRIHNRICRNNDRIRFIDLCILFLHICFFPQLHITYHKLSVWLFVCECVRLVSGRYGVAMMVGVHFISHLISNIYQRVCIFFVLCVLGFILTIGCRLQSKSITHSNFYRHIAHRTIKGDYQKQF